MMKALSIRQPWAWLIAQGFKPVENRTWVTYYRGPILIHAGQQMTRGEYEEAYAFMYAVESMRPILAKMPGPAGLERGGIVGRAKLVACLRQHESPFFVGPFGFVLADAKPLAFTPLKGALGLFDVPGVWP